MGSSDTLHVGDLPLHLDRDGLALLPGDVLAVVVASPHLLVIDDLPDCGAVLLGHVLALIHVLSVNLWHHRLRTILEILLCRDGLAFIQLHVLHLHLAVCEQFYLQRNLFHEKQGQMPITRDRNALSL